MASLTNPQRRRQAVRTDDRGPGSGSVVSYRDEDGEIRDWQGEDLAPYVIACGIGGAGIEIQGAIAHDDPDNEATEKPVKIGGHATASPRAPVSADDDKTTASYDREGRIRARISGTDDNANAVDVGIDEATALMVGGQVNHDAADTGFPLLVGGRATDETPGAVADDDRVRRYHTLEGRGVVLNDMLNAGEDLTNHVLATVLEPLAVEQHALDIYVSASGEESVVVKANPGRIYEVHAIIDAGINADRYLHIFNQTAALAGGETPIWRALLPDSGTGGPAVETQVVWEFTGLYCDTGILIAISSTRDTFTGAGNVAVFHASFK